MVRAKTWLEQRPPNIGTTGGEFLTKAEMELTQFKQAYLNVPAGAVPPLTLLRLKRGIIAFQAGYDETESPNSG
jgi:hypothetical protein